MGNFNILLRRLLPSSKKQVTDRFDSLERRIDTVLTSFENNLAIQTQRMDFFAKNLESLKNEMETIKTNFGKTNDRIDELNEKSDESNQEFTKINIALNDINKKNEILNNHIELASKKSDELKNNISGINSSVEVIKQKYEELKQNDVSLNLKSDILRTLFTYKFYPETFSMFSSLRKIKENVYLNEFLDGNLLSQLSLNFDVDYVKTREILTSRFAFLNKKYIENNYFENKKRRLFVCTGTLSLINSLCYMEQTGEKEKFDDTMIIIMGSNGHKFTEAHLNIIENYNFEKVFMLVNGADIASFLFSNNLYNYDECIIVHHAFNFPVVKNLFIASRLVYIYETPSFFSCAEDYLNKPQFLYVQNYSDKIDYAYPETNIPVKYADKKILKRLLLSVQERLKLHIEVEPNEKWILFLGPDLGTLNMIEERDEFVLQYIKKFQNAGYKVLYKNHPRIENKFYEEKGVILLKEPFPSEFYDLKNILCVVGFRSGALVTLQEQNVPTFCIIDKEICDWSKRVDDWFLLQTKKQTFAVENYVMPYQILLHSDSSKSFSELRKDLEKKQKEFLASKPKLSENAEFKRLFPLDEEQKYVL